MMIMVITKTNQGYVHNEVNIRIALHCIEDSDIPDGRGASWTLNKFAESINRNCERLSRSADTAVVMAAQLVEDTNKKFIIVFNREKIVGAEEKKRVTP